MKLALLGLDRAIAITLCNRAWALLAGPVSLLFIVRELTPAEQGFYFTFNSVLGLQVFFELGLGFVVLQTVSHLMASVRLEPGRLEGDAVALGRLGRLLADVLKRFAVISLLFTVLVAFGGAWFLGRGERGASVDWLTAWLLVTPVFGATIVSNVIFSFLEGLGMVQDVALARLLQSLLAMVGLWVALSFGMKLVSLAVLHALNLLVAVVWILGRHQPMLAALLRGRSARGAIDWRREIWPFQWRIAISWAAGYLGSQAITLIAFDRLGAVDAGRVGLSMTLMGAASAAAMAWITTKTPRFGRLVAQREFSTLWQLFRRSEWQAVSVAMSATIIVLLIVAVLNGHWPQFGARFLPLLPLTCLAAATVVGVHVSARAIYLRAFRREPFMAMSVASGFAIALSALLAAPLAGATGLAAAYLLVTVAITLLWCRPLFQRCQREYTRE